LREQSIHYRMETNKTCTICQIEIINSYCGDCGQKINTKKTTILSIISDFVSNMLSLERSVFATLIKLIISPGKVIDNYMLGFRNYYQSPAKILFYALTYAAIHVTYIDSYILGGDMQSSTFSNQFLFSAVFIPFTILTSYLTFIRRKYGFTKHLVTMLYLTSCFFLVFMILYDLIVWLWSDYLIEFIYNMKFINRFIIHEHQRQYLPYI